MHIPAPDARFDLLPSLELGEAGIEDRAHNFDLLQDEAPARAGRIGALGDHLIARGVFEPEVVVPILLPLGQPQRRRDAEGARLERPDAIGGGHGRSDRDAATHARSDEKRYATLVQTAAASVQRHEQAKAALDTAEAQLAAAEAEARVAENEATYSTLAADADGTVVVFDSSAGDLVTTWPPTISARA